jgi:hypothetical protein
MAPANVLHGAVREQGLTSSPTPETQVRVAWAMAGVADSANRTAKAAANLIQILGILCSIADFVAQTRIRFFFNELFQKYHRSEDRNQESLLSLFLM